MLKIIFYKKRLFNTSIEVYHCKQISERRKGKMLQTTVTLTKGILIKYPEKRREYTDEHLTVLDLRLKEQRIREYYQLKDWANKILYEEDNCFDWEKEKLTYSIDLTEKQREQLKYSKLLYSLEYETSEKDKLMSIKEIKNRYKGIRNELEQGYYTHIAIMTNSLRKYIRSQGFKVIETELEDYASEVITQYWAMESKAIRKNVRYCITNRLPIFVVMCSTIRFLFMDTIRKEQKRKALLFKKVFNLDTKSDNPFNPFYRAYRNGLDDILTYQAYYSIQYTQSEKELLTYLLKGYKQQAIAKLENVTQQAISKQVKKLKEKITLAIC